MEPAGYRPSLGHYQAPSAFSDDLAILSKYQSFSAEILRIALLGLSALGIGVSSLVLPPTIDKNVPHLVIPDGAKYFVVITATLFGFSAAFAVLHRYFSADSMAAQLRILRLERRGKPDDKCDLKSERAKRSTMLTVSSICIAAAPACLAAGGLTFAVALALVLFDCKQE